MSDYLTVPGAAMTQPERQYLHDLAVEAASRFGPDCTIVNIGVGMGCSCICLRTGAPDATLIGVDIDPMVKQGDWVPLRADSRRLVWPSPIHLLFVDGAHDYAAVKSDIQGWTPSVVPGGLVVFHDYGNAEILPWTAGVRQAVDECMGDGWADLGLIDSIKAFKKGEGAGAGGLTLPGSPPPLVGKGA